MMTATLIHLMLFPQLYILVGSTNKKLTLVLQLVFIVPMMTLTTPDCSHSSEKKSSDGAVCEMIRIRTQVLQLLIALLVMTLGMLMFTPLVNVVAMIQYNEVLVEIRIIER